MPDNTLSDGKHNNTMYPVNVLLSSFNFIFCNLLLDMFIVFCRCRCIWAAGIICGACRILFDYRAMNSLSALHSALYCISLGLCHGLVNTSVSPLSTDTGYVLDVDVQNELLNAKDTSTMRFHVSKAVHETGGARQNQCTSELLFMPSGQIDVVAPYRGEIRTSFRALAFSCPAQHMFLHQETQVLSGVRQAR